MNTTDPRVEKLAPDAQVAQGRQVSTLERLDDRNMEISTNSQ